MKRLIAPLSVGGLEAEFTALHLSGKQPPLRTVILLGLEVTGSRMTMTLAETNEDALFRYVYM